MRMPECHIEVTDVKRSFELYFQLLPRSKVSWWDDRDAVAPNRIKELVIVRPGQVVVSDCTYLRLAGREFAYLFLVTDAFTRMIVGYHVSKDLSHYSYEARSSSRVTIGDYAFTLP